MNVGDRISLAAFISVGTSKLATSDTVLCSTLFVNFIDFHLFIPVAHFKGTAIDEEQLILGSWNEEISTSKFHLKKTLNKVAAGWREIAPSMWFVYMNT